MKIKRALVFGDSHFPYADNRSVDICLQIAKNYGPWDDILAIGDIFDCYCMSRFPKNPLKLRSLLAEETTEGRRFLMKLGGIKCWHKVFMCGNHEDRIRKAIFDGTPALAGHQSIGDYLGLPQGWEVLPYGSLGHIKLGPLVVTHGVKSGVNAAKDNAKKYGCSVLTGHTHRNSSHSYSTYDGKTHTGYTIGGLWSNEAVGEYQPDVIDGSRGLAIVEYTPEQAAVEIVSIEADKVILRGRVL